MTTPSPHESVIELRRRLAIVAGVALLAAGLVLVLLVLPAEYALDPLGTGKKLGLLPLGVTGQQVDALNAAGAASRTAGESAKIPRGERFTGGHGASSGGSRRSGEGQTGAVGTS